MFVKTGDKVKVIAGKDKGKEGTVLSVNAKTNRIVVKGVNKIKKHEKPSQANANGGVVEKEGSIHASNVKVIAKKKITTNRREDAHGKQFSRKIFK